MTLKFHNTLTRQTEDFTSITPGEVKLYTCGPTVYGSLHVGNWAAYIYWDILVRTLIANDFKVERVMNITDVGHLVSDADEGQDKLEKGAKREGKTAWEIAKFYTDDFLNGMKQLGLIMPQHLPLATDFIDQQLELVRTLKSKGFTYQISDGIYFDTSKFPTYADFAHIDLEGLKAGARVEYNTNKRNLTDFALWKFTPVGEKRDMEWETPSDLTDLPTALEPLMGFPGWHLECSAMAMSLLGDTLDIHTGGIDHIQIHHTNEIAQSEAATGHQFSHFWLHNNHLTVDGTKISKSLDNGYTLDDLRQRGFKPADYRMFVLQSHYRNETNFTFDNLTAAKNRLHNWRNIAALRHQTHDTITSSGDTEQDSKSRPLYGTIGMIKEALDSDLGSQQALHVIDEAFSELSGLSLDRINQHALVSLLQAIDDLLGLQLLDSTPDVDDGLKQIIIARNHARANKDWKLSDELRVKIEKQGILVRDTSLFTVWEYAS